VAIPAVLVARTAAASGKSLQSSLDAVVEDALVAEDARAQGLDRAPAVRWAATGVLARREQSALAEQAASLGPPTDDELSTIQVVHAVVRRGPTVSESLARATIAAIREAVLPAKSADDFLSRAQAVPHGDLRIRAEPLRDLRVDTQGFDADFVAAAFALRSVGDTSPVTESSFGWHVIRLVDRVPVPASEIEERRTRLRDVIPVVRARERIGRFLQSAHERTKIEIAPGAQDLMAQVASRQP
jgi:hypothetical protein